MKKRVIAAVAGLALALSACADSKTINGVTYEPYGLVTAGSKQNPNIKYNIVWGNVFWAVVLSETVVAPIYFVGWSLYEPVAAVDPSAPKGSVGAP
jgi:hypothetical protein